MAGWDGLAGILSSYRAWFRSFTVAEQGTCKSIYLAPSQHVTSF